MKKDYFWFTIVGLFIFGYVLDQISGPIAFANKNPYAFLSGPNLSTYPLTAVSIMAKAVGIMFALITLASYIKGAHLLKAIFFFFIGSLAQLYAIQQLATRGKITTIPWTIGIAYAGALLLLPAAFQLLQALLSSAHQAIKQEILPVKHDLPRPPTTTKS